MKPRNYCAAMILLATLCGCADEESETSPMDLLTETKLEPVSGTIVEEPDKIIPASNQELFALANEAGTGPQDVVFYSRRNESLSLFAQWSGLTRTILSEGNHLKDTGKELPLHTPITIPLSADQLDRFEHARDAFHDAYQTRFYEKYKVVELQRYSVVQGDSLWKISRKQEELVVPLWLLEKVNPGRDLNVLQVGNSLQIPIIARVGGPIEKTKSPRLASTKPVRIPATSPAPAQPAKKTEKIALEAQPSRSIHDGLNIKVQRGESLSHYATWSGLPVSAILKANELIDPDRIRLGQPLCIPIDDKHVANFYLKRRSFLQGRGIPEAETKAQGQWTTHKVAPGETAWVIAIKRYAIPLSEIEALNPHLNLDRLMPGTLLRIPVQDSVSD